MRSDDGDGTATKRIVLRLYEDATVDHGELWELIGPATNAIKATAIRDVAKDEPGKYRAPSLRAWKGGLEVVLPEKPKPESRLFE